MKSPLIELGEVVTFRGGGTPDRSNPEYWDGEIPWATVKDLKTDTLRDTQEYITREGLENSASTIIDAGTVIMATRMGLGKVAVNTIPMAINQDLKGVVCGSRIVPQYLLHFLSSKAGVLEAAGHGATVKGVKLDYLRSIKIPLPPLDEQRRIAAILDKANSIQTKIKKQTNMSEELVLGTFSDLFGDPVRNSKKWKTIEIEKLCHLVRGSSPRPQGDPRYFGGDIPRLMVADLTRDGWFVTPRIDTLTREGAKHSRPVARGTIVMAVSGNVGIVSQLSVDACIHDGFVGFVDLDISKMLPTYLMACLELFRWTHVSRQAGAIFQNLTTTDIKALRLPVPPLELQKQFEAAFFKITALKSVQERRQQEVENLLARLQRDSFKDGKKNA